MAMPNHMVVHGSDKLWRIEAEAEAENITEQLSSISSCPE